jgi:hypothetical protein
MRLWSDHGALICSAFRQSIVARGRVGSLTAFTNSLSASPEKNSQRGENCPRYARAAQLLFGRLGLLVDCRLSDFGERLVRGLFLIKRFVNQFDGVIQTELFRPGL